MAELTATGRWELEVVLTDYSGTAYTALYSDFSVGDSSTNYRLSLSGYNAARSTLPDSLNDNYHTRVNGMAFSTRDRDHDNFSASCSSTYFGDTGWWFNNCCRTLLTGRNYNDITKNDYAAIYWYSNPAILPAGSQGSWPAAEMRIRKK